ncbi:MAG: nicotinate-nucleotide--dimethylbenzimidazole phosphoribosyltransferase [Phyllobacteriaceae bacterium]|nr:nicotinate-nucleotide--dimethylbenzimidazole phosphoribosyltransferase [Phyllobacteriaceae bacterium]
MDTKVLAVPALLDSVVTLADFRRLVAGMPGPDRVAAAAFRARDVELTKIPGSLGRLEEIGEWLATWSGRTPPRVEAPLVAVFAANHGIAAKGVSAFPAEVTVQMVANYAAGGAAINQFCKAGGLALEVHALDLDHPTPDVSETDAFDEAGLVAALRAGFASAIGGTDLLCFGEMGIGNTAIASAIFMGLTGGPAEDWVGPGTGVVGPALAAKRSVVTQAVTRIGDEREPLEVLRRLGGREIAAMVGAIVAARHARVPVIVDGFVTTAAAAVVHALDPAGIDHCVFAHRSAEPAHRRILERMGKEPLLDLGLRLGEGTGAAAAAHLVRLAAAYHAGMATFAEAGVSNKE